MRLEYLHKFPPSFTHMSYECVEDFSIHYDDIHLPTVPHHISHTHVSFPMEKI